MLALVLAGCGGRDAGELHDAQPETATPAESAVAWHSGNAELAFASARAQNKLVLVYFGAQWCPYCEALRTTVFTRADFIAKTRQFVPVAFDGDLPDAQQWGRALKVTGYPTMLVLRPDRTEIARLAGGMDLTRYAALLEDVLQDERPILDVLAAAAGGPKDSPISAEDCRRLAYDGWDSRADEALDPFRMADQLTVAAARCPAERARLDVHALAFLLDSESGGDRAPGTELASRLHGLADVLNDRPTARGLVDLLSGMNASLFQVVSRLDPAFAQAFHASWVATMTEVTEDDRFGEAEQLMALASALSMTQGLRTDHAIPDAMARSARARIEELLASDREGHSRSDIVNAARRVYVALGDDAAAYALLERELPRARTPYYYMSSLAALDEKRGRTREAIEWLERAYAATHTSGARIRWGERYVLGLIRLAPDEVQRIERSALEVVDEMDGAGVLSPRARERIVRLTAALDRWVSTPERGAAAVEVKHRLIQLCDQEPAADAARDRCREAIRI